MKTAKKNSKTNTDQNKDDVFAAQKISSHPKR